MKTTAPKMEGGYRSVEWCPLFNTVNRDEDDGEADVQTGAFFTAAKA
jgi:hypothetical protein